MVILYTNENNPASLKILIAKEYSKKDVETKIVNVNDRSIELPRHLPYLEITSDQVVFIPNVAVLYLLPALENIALNVDEWLEFESSLLSPSLAHAIGSTSKNPKFKQTLTSVLNKLNTTLTGKKYLVGNNLTACDISIWATLYPLYKDQSLNKEYLGQHTSLISWIQDLEKVTQFKDALSNYKLEGGQTSYNALYQGAKYLVSNIQDQHENPQAPQTETVSVSSEELEAAEKAWKKTSNDLPKLKERKNVVLPVAGEKNVFITSALPYVNNVPHLGNIIGCVLSADVFARFSRLCNYNTLYICGTDEYGTATETKALEEGLSCQVICDKYHKIHREIYEWFNISFDHFGRTSTEQQKELCQEMFLTLNHNGFTFTQSVEQLHCESCDRFLADRFVEGGCPNLGCTYEDARGDQCDGCGKLVTATELKNPRCKICSKTPKLKSSSQFFIDLPKLEPLLHHWVKKTASGWSNNAQVIAKAWLKEGLKPRCITRDLKWGVPVPLDGFRNKVFYVWFDAPIGYISISKAYSKDYLKWWIPEKNLDLTMYQFMAKDNVPFHSVLFPAMLLGANKGYVTVNHIMSTEYLNYEDGKFSKSRGVGVFGTDAKLTKIPSDVWRFYLLYVRPENQDSSFCWVDLATKNNSELLNNLGNFINRALVFAKNNFNKTVPAMQPSQEDYILLSLCTRELKAYIAALSKAKLRDGIRHILAISRHGNQYMQANQPWVLLKGTDEEKIRAGTVIGICCNLACLLATLLQPYMPETSDNLKKQLNCTNVVITPDCVEIVTLLKAGHKLGEPSPLFAKIEPDRVEELKKMFAGQDAKSNNVVSADVKKLEDEVAKQADKVRALKSSGKEKALWQPEVTILLDLKKKLDAAQKSGSKAKPSAHASNVGPQNVKALEEAVAKQADKVRTLKTSGKEKAIWQPEVAVLLDLKKKLELAQKGGPATQNSNSVTQNVNAGSQKSNAVTRNVNAGSQNLNAGPVDMKSLEFAVSKQADIVRNLKASTKDKAVWQPEVNLLLDLKKQLEAAKTSSLSASEPISNSADFAEIKRVEDEIMKQGLVVRKLKDAKSDRPVWQPEVDKLLELKKKLSALTGTPVAGPPKGKSKK